jgi:hypothetical protein
LNAGFEYLAGQSVNCGIVISNKAIGYLNWLTVFEIAAAFKFGSKIVGVAIDEFKSMICEGRVQNTFSAWDIRRSLEAGGFDSELDVEEVSLSVKILKAYPKSMAIIIPPKAGLDVRKSHDGLGRHKEVLANKETNQRIEIARMGLEFDFLKNNIMNGYPLEI